MYSQTFVTRTMKIALLEPHLVDCISGIDITVWMRDKQTNDTTYLINSSK